MELNVELRLLYAHFVSHYLTIPFHVTLTWPQECRQEPSNQRFAAPDEQKQENITLCNMEGKDDYLYTAGFKSS